VGGVGGAGGRIDGKRGTRCSLIAVLIQASRDMVVGITDRLIRTEEELGWAASHPSLRVDWCPMISGGPREWGDRGGRGLLEEPQDLPGASALLTEKAERVNAGGHQFHRRIVREGVGEP